MGTTYDAIVIGARCGGSPTAMLLARKGYRVLLVDKATFPSDTMSTHVLHPPAVAALARWGLLDRLVATNCPPIHTYSYDFGPITIKGSSRPIEGNATVYAPRRTVLDALLVEAAVEAGAELREAFTVQELLFEDDRVVGIRGHAKGGASVTEKARVVIGADGKHSLVAKAVQAESYNEVPTLESPYYAYWSGMPTDGFEIGAHGDQGCGWGVIPTHDDLTCVIVGTPRAQFDQYRRDIEGTYMRAFDVVPEFAERMRAATRETRFVGTGDLPGYFRKPYGPGWALVGDAGYHKDPITAFGIHDAFLCAELLTTALDDTIAARRPWDEAMAGYQRTRDEKLGPIYEFTGELAKLEPPPPEMQQLLGAVYGNQEAMDDFVSMTAGTLPAPEFFAPENIGRIMSGAAAPTG